ncbi:MAG: aryldialkylphosphatase [Armatimonadetes bacterium]|nr:aryldialkylphosphatase [Armatimonadota bacterium]
MDIVQTVLGPIPPDALGVTMTHEHLLVDFRYSFREPEALHEKHMAYAPWSLDLAGWIRHHWNLHLDNMTLFDEDVTIDELRRFSRVGGQAVVDATSIGIGRDPRGLARIARATGLHIVMGAGHYLGATHPPAVALDSVEMLAEGIARDVTVGVGDSGVRAGMIGEIGCSSPWSDGERKAMNAAVIAQRRTGAPLMIHPWRDDDAPLRIADAVRAWDGDLARTIMCHVERTIVDRGALAEFAATGAYLELDLFGHEVSHVPGGRQSWMPSDAQRIEMVRWLIERGYGDKILLSHDICYKFRLRRYGGHGWDHLLTNVVPHMRTMGVDEAAIRAMLVDNPRRAFSMPAPDGELTLRI